MRDTRWAVLGKATETELPGDLRPNPCPQRQIDLSFRKTSDVGKRKKCPKEANSPLAVAVGWGTKFWLEDLQKLLGKVVPKIGLAG